MQCRVPKKGVAKLIFPVKQVGRDGAANANRPSDGQSDVTLRCPTHFPRLSDSALILKLPVMKRGRQSRGLTTLLFRNFGLDSCNDPVNLFICRLYKSTVHTLYFDHLISTPEPHLVTSLHGGREREVVRSN